MSDVPSEPTLDPMDDIVEPVAMSKMRTIRPFPSRETRRDTSDVLGGEDDRETEAVLRRAEREREQEDTLRAARPRPELPEERPQPVLNGWTDTIQLIANDIAQKTLMLKEIHAKAARTYKHRSRVFEITLIAVSSIASVLTVFPTDANPWNPFAIFTKIFTYAVTFLTVLNRFLKFSSLAEQHREAEGKFLEFYHSIQSQLLLDDWTKREEGSTFLAFVFKTFPSIIKEAPDPPPQLVADTRSRVEENKPLGGDDTGPRRVVQPGDEQDVTLGVRPGQIPLTIITRTTNDTQWQFDISPLTRYQLSKFQTGQGL